MENTFNERGVAITRNALSAGGQAFSLREIRGVRIVTVRRNKAVPLAISLIGLAAAVFGAPFRSGAAVTVGIMLFVVGWLTWITQDVTHRLMITTPDGEREALTSLELDFVEHVEQTLRRALESARADTAR
ncbi:MAG TPA: DUF6232 family protein [Trinickia sp.]|jgi:hypothetical protein|nr:DUF6232 family protein [Trinickia sp.]